MQLSKEETIPPSTAPSSFPLTGDGSRKLAGEVVAKNTGHRLACSVTVWYCRPGKHASYRAGNGADCCTTVVARDGLFDLQHTFPGTYGPRHAAPHLKYIVVTTDGRAFFGTIEQGDPKRMVTYVRVRI